MRSLKEAARDWGVSYTVAKKWLTQGRIPQAIRIGRFWAIPMDLPRPPTLEVGGLRGLGATWNRGRK